MTSPSQPVARILAAPGAFKESLDAVGAAAAIARGVAAAIPEAVVDACPLADGGDGLLDAILAFEGGRLHEVDTWDALGEPVRAAFAMLADGTAVIESARACGLALVAQALRDPTGATSRGAGVLIAQAVAAGARRIVVGLGGSATTDGGAGMLEALGFELLDGAGAPIASGGAGVESIDRIVPPAQAWWRDVPVVLACDVDAPLLGRTGAARSFGPQKGATPDDVAQLERGLGRWAAALRAAFGVDVAERPGAGAAGGSAAGLAAALGATIANGADWVMERVGVDRRLEGVGLVLTGEGALDATSARGKLVARLANRARGRCPVVALVGRLGPGWEAAFGVGLSAAFALARGPASPEALRASVADDLARVAGQVARLASALSSVGPTPTAR